MIIVIIDMHWNRFGTRAGRRSGVRWMFSSVFIKAAFPAQSPIHLFQLCGSQWHITQKKWQMPPHCVPECSPEFWVPPRVNLPNVIMAQDNWACQRSSMANISTENPRECFASPLPSPLALSLSFSVFPHSSKIYRKENSYLQPNGKQICSINSGRQSSLPQVIHLLVKRE